jgi:hypothetical protein
LISLIFLFRRLKDKSTAEGVIRQWALTWHL